MLSVVVSCYAMCIRVVGVGSLCIALLGFCLLLCLCMLLWSQPGFVLVLVLQLFDLDIHLEWPGLVVCWGCGSGCSVLMLEHPAVFHGCWVLSSQGIWAQSLTCLQGSQN